VLAFGLTGQLFLT